MVLPTLLRKLHYWGSLVIALPIAVIICTGVLLQLKKDIAWIQPTEVKTKARELAITGDQIQLFKTDNVVAPGANTIADLGVTSLESVEAIVPTYLWRHRPHGQFQPPHIDEASRVDA